MLAFLRRMKDEAGDEDQELRGPTPARGSTAFNLQHLLRQVGRAPLRNPAQPPPYLPLPPLLSLPTYLCFHSLPDPTDSRAPNYT